MISDELKQWRKSERERLIAERLAIAPAERRAMSERIAAGIEREIGDVRDRTVSIYWPFRGEPDLRAFAGRVNERGGRIALPIVVRAGAPLMFRLWKQGDPLEKGVWNIPIPAADAPEAVPDVVIAPVVGFDPRRYRLGYGGGFFDRTLAGLGGKPLTVGIGFSQQAIETFRPHEHEIPMNLIVTEEGRRVAR
ncbi:MAG: 5-formyltetrahydrofolate cyclo-ligase [Flavobacteriaceae bacterium]